MPPSAAAAAVPFQHRHAEVRLMSLRGALANVRGRHGVRHIPGSGDQAVRL